ncbi:Met-10+ like-protein-domain-containing protein [Gongronella butleri]|nr:Met-10+ like-protein-domain-containing protein [Gongronella butleri]
MLVPPTQYGMTVLNREAFKATFQTLALRVPNRKVALLQKSLTTDVLDLPRMRAVVADPESKDNRLLLLRDDLQDIDTLAADKKKLVDDESLGVVQHTIEVDYDYWSTDQVLNALIPADKVKEIPSSFTQVGHIAHVNLRDDLLPWKHVIGEVLLDKNKNITSVVNKLNSIDTTFRFFQMEVLAGSDNMITEVKESNCRFKFDFSKVYWNSRLHTEHDRLVREFKKDQFVCDVMAGVGPFALPAAKKGVTVYANDLNPESFHWLKENKKLNKISDARLIPYNMDGREFIRQAVKDIAATAPTQWKTFDHFVMNLPDTAIEFLDAFRGVYKDHQTLYDAADPKPALPMIHCHCFSKSSEPATDIAQRVEQVIGSPYDTSSRLHFVRNVAPKKDMYCISFRLTPEMAFGSTR